MSQGEHADPLPMSLTGDEIAGLQPCRALARAERQRAKNEREGDGEMGREMGETSSPGSGSGSGSAGVLCFALLWPCYDYDAPLSPPPPSSGCPLWLRRCTASLVARPQPIVQITHHPSALHRPLLPPASHRLPPDGLVHRLHRPHIQLGTQAQGTAPATFGLLSRSTVQLLPSLAAWTCPSSSTLHQPPFLHLIC